MEQTRRMLVTKLRLLEVDLSNQSVNLYKAMKTASELEQAVEFTKEQIVMVQSQVARCGE